MKVVIASDFSGFRLKEKVKEHVISLDPGSSGGQRDRDLRNRSRRKHDHK